MCPISSHLSHTLTTTILVYSYPSTTLSPNSSSCLTSSIMLTISSQQSTQIACHLPLYASNMLITTNTHSMKIRSKASIIKTKAFLSTIIYLNLHEPTPIKKYFNDPE